jgi:hypothetical protein
MTLEEMLNLRGLDLAKAYLREVLRFDGPVPTPQPHMIDAEYNVGWAVRSWHKVRFRYNDRAKMANLPVVQEYQLNEEGFLSRPPYRKMTLFFSSGPTLEIRINGAWPHDLYLLAALSLYIALVRAGAVKPRALGT